MPERFFEKVEIVQPGIVNPIVISLDAIKSVIEVGCPGSDGSIILRNRNGTETILFNQSDAPPTVGPVIPQPDHHLPYGSIILKNQAGESRLQLNGENATIKILSQNGRPILVLDGGSGRVGVGGEPHERDNLLVTGSGDQSIRIASTDPQGSLTCLMAVTSNGRTESQLQFRERLSLIAPEGGNFVITVLENGRVGIGTANPGTNLHVAGPGNQAIDVSSADPGFRSHMRLTAVTSNNKTESQLQFRGEFHLVTPLGDEGGKSVLSALENGRVGIGTANPGVNLHVAGLGDQAIDISSTDPRFRSHMRLTAVTSNNKTESQLQFRGEFHLVTPLGDEGGKSVLSALENGRVGIGTANPGVNLHVAGLGDQAIDISSTDPRFRSHMRLTAVTSNEKTESQLQFRDELQFVTPLGDEGGKSVLSVHKEGKVWINKADGSPSILLDGEAGDILLSGADFAEDFDVEESQAHEPGTVMVIGDGDKLYQCSKAYDKRVAGVLSGAGNYRSGVVLGKQQSQNKRLPLALTGKVYCKVDTQYSPIEVGDLLTTSPTPGHAMKANDPFRAFGAVIGKALRPLSGGQGLIPVLIALQ